MVEVADAAGEGVLVEVTAVGICGSDLHLIEGWNCTVTPGHEILGTVDGWPVAVCPVEYCGTCGCCTRGVSSLCERGSAQVIGIHRDGGMADAVLVPESCLVELSGLIGLDPAVGFLVEPVAVGLHGWNVIETMTGMVGGARVAIVGAGTVGLIAGAVARHLGFDVDIVARHPGQQAAARTLGLGLDVRGNYDITVDAAGTASAIRLAAELARPGASVLMSGTYWGGDVSWPGLAAQLKELRLFPVVYYGHHRGGREIDAAARLVADLEELPGALVTHRFPLHEAAKAFATAADRASGAIKVVLEP